MDITIHATFLPHDDPEASLAFYRDTLGFEVRADVGSGKMRWITVGPARQPGTSILLAPPVTDPGGTDEARPRCERQRCPVLRPPPPARPARPSCWRRRSPTPASRTTSAVPSPR